MARPNFLRKTIEVKTKKELHELFVQLKEDKKLAGQVQVIAELNWADEDASISEYKKLHDEYIELFKTVGVPLKISWYDNTPWDKQVHTDDIDFGLTQKVLKYDGLITKQEYEKLTNEEMQGLLLNVEALGKNLEIEQDELKPAQVLQLLGADAYGEPLEEVRFIRIAFFDSPDAPRCYNGLAAQLAGNTCQCTALLLKTLDTTPSAAEQGLHEYIISSAGEWEWNGGEDLTGNQLAEAKMLYKDFITNKITEKEHRRTEERMKFVDFEDIYVNNEGGMDYWVICNNLPQKYVDEAKKIDGDNYNENCFGLIVTYGRRADGEEDKEPEWFIDSDAPFYVDNDGNWNYLDYKLTEDEQAEVIQMSKDEMNRVQLRESLKEKIEEVMDDLMQNNLPCNYVIIQNGTEEYVKNIYALDAYMKAYEMSKSGDIECYMAALGKENKATHPVFSVKNGEITLSGQKITVDAAMLIPTPIKRRGR